jgi:hypothetical protein
MVLFGPFVGDVVGKGARIEGFQRIVAGVRLRFLEEFGPAGTSLVAQNPFVGGVEKRECRGGGRGATTGGDTEEAFAGNSEGAALPSSLYGTPRRNFLQGRPRPFPCIFATNPLTLSETF